MGKQSVFYYLKTHALDAGSNKNNKNIEILLKRNWNFPKHIFNKNIERILNNKIR